MSIGLLVLGLLLFIMLVVVHEFGHFIVARRGGVDVEEFGIFFPPRLWSKEITPKKRLNRKGSKTTASAKKKSFLFSINLLPLGGFVRMKGEHDSDTEPGTFGAASLATKVKIMLAGVGMNLLAAFVLLLLLAWVGMPQLVSNQFTVKSDTHVVKNEVLAGYIEPHSPAQKAGLTSSDRLLAIIPVHGAKVTITTAARLPSITKQFAGQTVGLEFIDNGRTETKQITFQSQKVVAASLKTNNPKGYLGISPTQYNLQRSTWSAPIVAGGLMVQYTALTFQGLGHALGGLGSILAGAVSGNHAAREAGQTTASSQVSGPIGIFELLKDGSLLGYQFILAIVAIISLSLAIMNVLPIPALDGGRLFVTLISRLLHKPLTIAAENAIYGTGFALLLLLITVITIVDVKRYF